MPPRPARLGLTEEEASARLARDGPNQLPPPRRRPASCASPTSSSTSSRVMLWVAGGLALIAGFPQLGVAIVAVIVLNAVFAFVQERRADQAAERLRPAAPACDRAARRPAGGDRRRRGRRGRRPGPRGRRSGPRRRRACLRQPACSSTRRCSPARANRRPSSATGSCSPARSWSRARPTPSSRRRAGRPGWPTSPA